jgi:hypothetical protein
MSDERFTVTDDCSQKACLPAPTIDAEYRGGHTIDTDGLRLSKKRQVDAEEKRQTVHS